MLGADSGAPIGASVWGGDYTAQDFAPSAPGAAPSVAAGQSALLNSGKLTLEQVQHYSVPIQNNPSVLLTPGPGTTAVQPQSSLFASIFKALTDGATPFAQMRIQMAAEEAAKRGQPVYIPTPIVNHSQAGTYVVGIGAIAIAAILLWVFLRKK